MKLSREFSTALKDAGQARIGSTLYDALISMNDAITKHMDSKGWPTQLIKKGTTFKFLDNKSNGELGSKKEMMDVDLWTEIVNIVHACDCVKQTMSKQMFDGLFSDNELVKNAQKSIQCYIPARSLLTFQNLRLKTQMVQGKPCPNSIQLLFKIARCLMFDQHLSRQILEGLSCMEKDGLLSMDRLAFIIANCEILIYTLGKDKAIHKRLKEYTKGSHLTRFRSFALPLIVHDVIRAIGQHGNLQIQDPDPTDFLYFGEQCIRSMAKLSNDVPGIDKVLKAFSDRAKKQSVQELHDIYNNAQQPIDSALVAYFNYLSTLMKKKLVIENHPLLNIPFGNERKNREHWTKIISHGRFDHTPLWPAYVPYMKNKQSEKVEILVTFCAFLRSVNVGAKGHENEEIKTQIMKFKEFRQPLDIFQPEVEPTEEETSQEVAPPTPKRSKTSTEPAPSAVTEEPTPTQIVLPPKIKCTTTKELIDHMISFSQQPNANTENMTLLMAHFLENEWNTIDDKDLTKTQLDLLDKFNNEHCNQDEDEQPQT